jgi:hypothetical protein
MNTPGTYRTKPHYIQAIQWTGDNKDAILDFVQDSKDSIEFLRDGSILIRNEVVLTSVHIVRQGDWLVRAGKYIDYCTKSTFRMCYEPCYPEE